MNTVQEVMTRDVQVVRGDRDVRELERLLLRERIHGVPVVDEQERLVGVVSQTDVLAWHYVVGVDGATFYGYTNLLIPGEGDFKGLELGDVRSASVHEIMSPLTLTVGPEDSIAAAATLMIRHKVHRLIVVDETSRVVGIVSAVDLLRALPGVEAEPRAAGGPA